MSASSNSLVHVLHARPDEQLIVPVDFEPGMTAATAVERSGLSERFPELTSQVTVLGVWGREVPADHKIKPGDRIEISRPLQADPRDMRRDFMTDGRVMGGAAAPASGVRKKVGG